MANTKKAIFIALLIFTSFLILYLILPSTRYNLDGLRVFSGLHSVTIDSAGAKSYTPLSWNTGYIEPYYSYANVQKHFLFPSYAFVVYQIARLFRYQGNSLRPLQVANAILAALAIGLFSLLLGLLFGRDWLTITAGIGLVFSTAFSAMATNIGEVVPAIPWLILAITILTLKDIRLKRYAIIAGIFLGISACFYLVSAVIGVVIAIGVLVRHHRRSALIFFGLMFITTLTIYLAVLILAGHHNIRMIWHLLTFMPEQGTYGGLRATNFITVLLGFANSLFPILPEDFIGLRQLITNPETNLQSYYSRIAALLLIGMLAIVLFFSLLKVRHKLEKKSNIIVFFGILIFVSAFITSLFWDPYHPKIWMYSNLGLWLIIAGFMNHIYSKSHHKSFYQKLLTIMVCTIMFTNLLFLFAQHKENPKWKAAQVIDRIVTSSWYSNSVYSGNFILGGWEAEFGYLTLLLPSHNIITLPDLVLTTGRNRSYFENQVDTSIEAFQRHGSKVYFVNLFNQTDTELQRFYVKRLRFSYFLTWLECYRNRVKVIWNNPKTRTTLYQLE